MNKQMFDKENTELVEGFLNRTHFEGWKSKYQNTTDIKYLNYRRLELQINANCNLACSYCYYCKFQEELYPLSISKPDKIKENLELTLNWLKSNDMIPAFDVFSGDPLIQDIGVYVVERLINWHIENGYRGEIIIPTNFGWTVNSKRTAKVQELLDLGKNNNVHVGLSCSIDGKFVDEYRPFKTGKIKDDDYYHEIFTFCAKNSCSFHPMIYSEGIDKWIENFLWFQDMLKKYNIYWERIYLLEVRNANWTDQNIKEFYKVIRFISKWIFDKLDSNGMSNEQKVKYLFKSRMMNLFGAFSTVGRGLGCSIQSTVQLRLGDLAATLCHRQSYKQLIPWKFIVDDDKITGIEGVNIAPYLAEQTTTYRNFPYCQTCLIKHMCSGGCLGQQFEDNGDMFVPVPTVCALEHAKVAALIDTMKEEGLLSYIYHMVQQEKKDTIDAYFSYFKGVNNDNG